MVITSKQNDKIKRISSLKDKKYRREYGEYVVEGVKMTAEAISLGMDVRAVVGTSETLSLVPDGAYERIETSENVAMSVSDTVTPQGIVAVLGIPENVRERPEGNCAVLDGISDPGNLGTIIRVCAALGIRDVYLCECADPFSPKAIRASMSGIFRVKIHSFDRATVADLVSDCTVAVADMKGENVFYAEVNEPYALVVGNEANGVSEWFKNNADKIISLPMPGGTESLNVSVAFAVAAYALQAANKKFI